MQAFIDIYCVYKYLAIASGDNKFIFIIFFRFELTFR